ncbi:MAG: ATP cone domain-containing protein, partial [Bacillota bacterium]|nr:ATP cone domain-containing protein [Bacillota bacterium]
TQGVEKDIRSQGISEIKSDEVGEMVMDRLASVDEVAYVRFASVYRQFKDINVFIEELKELIKKENS